MSELCPCQSGKAYTRCCQPFHRGELPLTAEQLMRSRYSAFVLELGDYLLVSWHPASRPAAIDFNDGPKQKWLGLQIKRHQQLDETHAQVEFVARYAINGRAQRLHEISDFVREDGRWLYVSGQFVS